MKLQMFQNKDKQWYWRLKHANGNIMADSGEGYKNKEDCITSLHEVKIFFKSFYLSEIEYIPYKRGK